jgi:formamidase
MVAKADPGERIVFLGRDAFDLTLDPDKLSVAKSMPRQGFGIVHALTGPVFINGAEAGDVLAVTIEAFEPDDVGWTEAGPFGFAGDQFGTDERFIVWRINDDYAVSDALPGVRIPNGPRLDHSVSLVTSSGPMNASSYGASMTTMPSAMHYRACVFRTRVFPVS